MSTSCQPRIGIYSGAFNPVHAGHIAVALQVIRAARLDQLVFLPERLPRQKPGVEHFAHRVAMLKQAIRPYPNMTVLELPDRHFTVARTWPQLRAKFAGCTLVLALGSDVARSLPYWAHATTLLRASELVVVTRGNDAVDAVSADIAAWPITPKTLTILPSFAPQISSSAIRLALQREQPADGLLASVRQYVRRNWLYISLETIFEKSV